MEHNTSLPGQPVSGATLNGLFRETVLRHGDRPAVRDDRTNLSYRQLDRASDALAVRLRGAGVQRGDRVAYHLERGVQVFVTLLAVLKAGAAYVPVDTRYPDARRDLMITRSRPALVVTDSPDSGHLAGLGVKSIRLADLPDVGEGTEPSSGRQEPVDAADPAALLFTSGSSGTPKAVVLTHENLHQFAYDDTLPRLGPEDRVGHVSSLSFDAFHYETWCAFASGAEIVVLPTMPDLVGRDIQRELRRHRISAMLVPTMAFNHVVREDRDAFSPLRILCTGGDVILPQACRDLLAGSFSGRLFNLYGPTEATTACAAYEVRELAPDAASVPIGRPLRGATLRVLDASSRAEVGPGESGELYVAGSGVALGYLDQPELTDERFPRDPFAADGSRMYATGDLVRLDAEGQLHYLGRTDDQVKIRGYRVEPREVERTLARHGDIREVAVLPVGEGEDRHLVGLVVADGPVSLSALREYAEAALPDFMVPSALIRVPEIPATAHGKRDLDQLRHVVAEHQRRDAAYITPRDEEERYLAAIWQELLAVERAGATDDFFELGGNSLLSFRLLRRVSKELGVTLSSREVLTTSRLESLAALIRDRKEAVRP
ncbi:non-ribosomal peptide synthetase [Streptomyces actinomycinicus]|uniref:non-ribosomal peptide synthetase n=1 Tax=Streptomyces actinomycinicus TaxID=1695166 RepID=UPI0027DA47C2|nr:non-ribosomal peptide synthetase [Streptomyces actinomycinicus]